MFISRINTLTLASGFFPSTFAGIIQPRNLSWVDVPSQAQRIGQKTFNVLPAVLPPSESNATTVYVPGPSFSVVVNTRAVFHTSGTDKESWLERPFHIYDDEFLAIIGPDPTLTLIAHSGKDPLFHEAVVWYPPTDEVFIAQNAGAPAAGTGLNKSSIISKISLSQAAAVKDQRNASGLVDVTTVDSNPMVINPNGATNYKGQFVYMSEGQGNNIPSEIIAMNPREPYNTTVLVNNYFGRQFNALNDAAVNPRNGDLYFTDPQYGYLQNFRPAPGLPNQVYRYNEATGAVTVVADGFHLPNGITFSPDTGYAYVADTGANAAFWGWNLTAPSSLYRFDVMPDGTFENRKLFAYVNSGIPDGKILSSVHCDAKGNVYGGTGDGIQVWNPSGKLIGKIYLGETSANFRFAGEGRMVIAAETDLFYATLAASGADFIE